MASELYIFEQGTPARASEVNKNFELVEKSVTDLKTVLETKIESDISSAKTSLLEDIQAVNDSSTDLNFSNVKNSAILNVMEWLAPDLENKIDVTNLPFKAPSYGYWHHFGINTLGYVYINGIKFDHYLWHTSGTAPGHQSLTFLLSPNDEVTYEQNKPKNMYFIPCKGLLMGVKDDE